MQQPLTSIFELPTIALLAQRIEAMQVVGLPKHHQTTDDPDMEVVEL